MMFKKQRKFRREEVLAARPIQNPATTWEKDMNEEAVIFIPRRDVWWVKLAAKIFLIPEERKLVLDRLGTEVWELCTGENTVKDLVNVFHQRHKLTKKQAETAMITYLNQMARRGLIGFLIENDPENKRKSGNG